MSQWTCNVCTYLNHPALPKCEICESDRESKPLQSVDGDLEFAKRLQEQFGKESTPQTQTKTNSNHNQPPKQPNSTSSSNSSSNHKSKPVPSTDADLEFAKRLQEQFDKESHQSDPSPIPTNDNHNRSIDSIPKPQSNDAPTSNSNSNSQKSTTESNKRSILPAPVPISNHKPPNADSTNRNRRRKRKRSEMESDSNVSSERHHHQCKIKEEEIKRTGHYNYNQTDIVSRIEHIRTGYEDLSHHNQMSVHVSPNTSVTCSAMSVFALKGQPYSANLTLSRSADFPYLTIDFNTTQVKVVTYSLRHPSVWEWSQIDEWQRRRVGDNNFMTSWVLEGNNDLHSNNWQIIHRVKNGSGKLEAGGVYSPVHFSVPDGVSGRYFTKIRLRMTALNSSGARTMKLAKVKLYGVMRRKVYQFPRRDEYKTIESFPAITKNKCIGDIDHVFKILNESESLEHHECKEYVQNIPDLKVQLKDYQRTGLQWLLHMENTGHNGIHGGLLCDEMGLGKTVQMIALMLVQKQRNVSRNGSQSKDRSLIVTPLSLIDQWISEISKIAGANTFTYINYYGQQRHKLTRHDFDNCDIVFSTTSTFGTASGSRAERYDDFTGQKWYQAHGEHLIFTLPDAFFARIIVDESHEIKNTYSQRSNAICAFSQRCPAKWCLSGTPVKNDLPSDLGGMMRFLGIKHKEYRDALKLTTREKSRELSLPVTMSKRRKEAVWGDLNVAYCRNKIETFLSGIMLRRTKNKVLSDDFVEKEEVVIKYRLNEEEQVIYEKNLTEATQQYSQFKRGGSVLSQYLYLLRMLSKLRQICNHPSLVFNKASIHDANDQNNINLSNVMDVSSIDILQRVKDVIIGRLNAMESIIDYECPVCWEMSELNGIMLSDCGHLFCAECIDDLEHKHCPLCREAFAPKNILKITAILQSKHLDSKHKDEYEAYKEEEGINDSKDNSDNNNNAKNKTKHKHYDEYMRKYGDACRSSSKIDALIGRLKYIEQHHTGDKALLFSNFPSFFTVISRQLKQHKIGHLLFHGSMNRKKRKKILDEFKSSAQCKVLLISAKCASVGLNLMCANHVIFIEPRYNPGLDNQAIGRCWRIGQTKKVYVTRVIMEDTVEEAILGLQQSKEENEESGLVNLKQKSKLSERDFDIIFKYRQGAHPV
eukprot:832361_1